MSDLFKEPMTVSTAYLNLTMLLASTFQLNDISTLKIALINQAHTPAGVKLNQSTKNKIISSKSSNDLLMAISDCSSCNWLNTTLLEEMAHNTTSDAIEMIEQYKLFIYAKKLKEVLLEQPNSTSKIAHYTTSVSAMMNVDPDEITVGDFLRLYSYDENIISDLSEGILNVERIKGGCLEAVHTSRSREQETINSRSREQETINSRSREQETINSRSKEQKTINSRSREQETINMKTVATYQAALKKGSQPSNQFKLVVLGAEAAGKTCTIDTLFDQPFQPDQPTTVGASVSKCKVHVDRHLSYQWEKVTASFCISQIPKQHNSEVKVAMSLISIETSLPSASAEPIPPQLVKEVIDTISSEDIQDQEVRSVIFDIGGQEVYYEIKFLFLSDEDVVMLVFDASKPLQVPVACRSGRFEEKAAARGMSSNINTIEVLLQSVYVRGHQAPAGFLSPRIPVVLVVGTHAEKLSTQDEMLIVSFIRKRFFGKPFMEHLPRLDSDAFHFIANSKPNVEKVVHLRLTILNGAKSVINVPRPISYLNFEIQVLKKYQDEVSIARAKATDMAKVAGIEGENDVDLLLRHFTNKGILLYYPEVESLKNIIFISPDEVSKLVCTVITTESCQPDIAELQHAHVRYSTHALLEEALFDFILKKCERYKDKDIILGLLNKFNIAAEVPCNITFPGEFITPKEGKVFMIPSLLVYDKIEAYQKTEGDIIVVYCAPRGFLSETVFNKLVVKTINWCYPEMNCQVYSVQQRTNKHQLHSVKRGISTFKFEDGLWQKFTLHYSQYTCTIKCYITIYHNKKPPSDQLPILLDQRRELLAHLDSSIAEIYKSIMPSGNPPQTFLECPVCDSQDRPPHIIELDIYKKKCLVCIMQDDTVRIHEKHYLLLFEPSLTLEFTPDNQIGDHKSLLAQEVEMWELIETVVPNVKAKWDRLAYRMRYNPREVKAFRKDSQDLDECCMKLFSDWLETGHGPVPKTYQTLLDHIKEIDDLAAASEEIERKLIQALRRHQ